MYIDDYSGYSGNKVNILHKILISDKFIVNFNNITFIEKREYKFDDSATYELFCKLNYTHDLVLFKTKDKYKFETFYESLVKFLKSDTNWFKYELEK